MEGADDASDVADAILARLDQVSASLWPRWKDIDWDDAEEAERTAVAPKKARRKRRGGKAKAKAPASSDATARAPLSQSAARANRAAKPRKAGSPAERPRKGKAPPRRGRRRSRPPQQELQSSSSESATPAEGQDSFADAVDQLRNRVGQLSAQLDGGGTTESAARSESDSPGASSGSARSSSSASRRPRSRSRRRTRSVSPAGARRRGEGPPRRTSRRSVTPSPARRGTLGNARGCVRRRQLRSACAVLTRAPRVSSTLTLDGLLQGEQRELRRVIDHVRQPPGTAAFALPVGRSGTPRDKEEKSRVRHGARDCSRRTPVSVSAVELSPIASAGDLGLSHGSLGGRLFRALATVEDLRKQRDADRISIRHLQRQLAFEKERVAAFKDKAAQAERLQRQMETMRVSLGECSALRSWLPAPWPWPMPLLPAVHPFLL